MEISWLGHSCFRITDLNGTAVVTDPFCDDIGYPPLNVSANVVLVSHNHYDHNNAKAVKGNPDVISTPGFHTKNGIKFVGIPTYHDDRKGKLRGSNIAFCFTMDGVRICHLGDLGHLLSENEAQLIGKVDVLLIPVGGIFTIDADGAKKVIKQLNPKVAIPMHYKTKSLSFELGGVGAFLKGMNVEGPYKSLNVSVSSLPVDDMKVVLLEYPS